MATPEEEEDVYLLGTFDDVQGFRVPPPRSAMGHDAKDWTQQVWAGRVDVMAKGAGAEVRLINPNGKLFAVCPVAAGDTKAVEPAYNSSRYFALRIQNASGKTALVGIVFLDRGPAFDFKMALHDHEEGLKREERAKELAAQDPGLGDLRLKEGQTIRVKVPRKAKGKHTRGGSGAGTAATGAGSGSGSGELNLFLAPPPGAAAAAPAGNAFLAPPPSHSRAAAASAPAPAPAPAAGALGDLFGAPAPAPAPAPVPAPADDPFGFGAFAAAVPAAGNAQPATSSSNNNVGSDWVSF